MVFLIHNNSRMAGDPTQAPSVALCFGNHSWSTIKSKWYSKNNSAVMCLAFLARVFADVV